MKWTEAARAILGGSQRCCPLLETEEEIHSGTKTPENENILFMLESVV